MRYFLNSGLKQENGEFYSSKAIRAKIKELIENENKETPLTDQEITNHFKGELVFEYGKNKEVDEEAFGEYKDLLVEALNKRK